MSTVRPVIHSLVNPYHARYNRFVLVTGIEVVLMPIYTYHCDNCGVQFERRQKFTDDPLTRCPECNQKALRKVYLPVGIVFKGSGFYATDNRSPSGANYSAKKTESDEKTPSESSNNTKTEQKTAEKSE
jgi:putative FmdB family regulatory protein